MTISLAQLSAPTPLATTPTTLYTVPSDGTVSFARVEKLTVFNGSAGAITLKVFVCPGGATPNISNNELTNTSINANVTFNSPNEVGHVLRPGDVLIAQGSGLGLVAMVSGIVVTP